VGWGSHYPIKHIIVGNDEIAENDWEKELILMAAPPGWDAQVLHLQDTLKYIHDHLEASDLSMILVSSPDDIKILADNGLKVKTINVGGIHFNEDRRQYLPYLFLGEKEIKVFEYLQRKGYVFECQDLPTNAKQDLAKVLEKR
jgi:mannose/fructose/N-acetylgalactosamine-specific phosphotransferase system component IIB